MLQLAPEDREIAMSRLVASLALEPLTESRFRADPGAGNHRLFGGLVAALALTAASKTLPSSERDGNRPRRRVHSLHGYFLRPGRHACPIDLRVEKTRDGRAFSVRRATASQNGKVIFELTASFCEQNDGISHDEPAPDVPPPEECGDREEARVAKFGDQWMRHLVNAVEVRLTDPLLLAPPAGTPAYQANWVRFPVPPNETPSAVAADFPTEALHLFASDRGLLTTAILPHGLVWGRAPGASLDHSLWLHRSSSPFDWHLYVSRSPTAHAGRAIIQTAIYGPCGHRVATTTQEALMRS